MLRPAVKQNPFLLRNLVSPVLAPARPRGGWDPRSPSTAALVSWYDPSCIASLFQDSAGTIPVAADGDPVGLMKDKSGNGNHVSQATSANRPLWRSDGSLDFDGVNDNLITAAALTLTDGSGQHSAAAAVKFNNVSGVQSLLDADPNGSTNRLSQFLRSNAGSPETIAFDNAGGAYVDSAAAISAGAGLVLSELASGSATEVFVNGVGNGSTARAGTAQTVQQTLSLTRGADAQLFNGRFYGSANYQGALSASDHAQLVAYLTAKLPGGTIYTIIINGLIAIGGSATETTAYARFVTGAVAIFGSVAKALSAFRSITGAMAVFASLTKAATYPRPISGLVAIFGSVSRAASFPRSIAGSIVVENTISRVLSAARSIASVVTVKSSQSQAASHPRSVSGSIMVVGSVSRTASYVRALSGSIATFATITTTKAYVRQIAVAVAILGKTATQSAFVRSISGAVAVQGVVSRILSAVRAIVPPQIVVDGAVTRTAALQRAVMGTVAVIGQVQNGKSYGRTVAAAVAVAASVQRVITRGATIAGQMVIAASITRRLAANRLVSGSIAIGSSVTRGLSLVRSFTTMVSTSASSAASVMLGRTITALVSIKAAVIAGAPRPFVPFGPIIKFVRERLPFPRAAREDRARKF